MATLKLKLFHGQRNCIIIVLLQKYKNNAILFDYVRITLRWFSWWCSTSASDSWSKGRWFDSRQGRYQVN